jgi:ATP adenylyltransferase
MKRLYAPWRHDYVNKFHTPDKLNHNNTKDKKVCVFCENFKDNHDEKHFIIKRFNSTVLMMNFYPYNVGHVMILPLEHKGELADLSLQTRTELMEILTLSMPILKEALNAQGFNVGINLGIAGGGGIPHHLHIHVLPRWLGDTNFLESIGQIKLLSSDFQKIYLKLKEKFGIITL